MKTVRRAAVVSLAAALVLPASAVAQPISEARIVILSHDAEDDRIGPALEAIAFWNQTFAELDLEPVLVEVDVVVSPPSMRALETYARRISTGAGRHLPGSSGPEPPRQLGDVDGDVIVLLSGQDLMPFSWPLPRSRRFFIAANAEPGATPRHPSLARNVIAHELGHAIGLTHRDDPTALMCLPCQAPAADGDEPAAFRRLTQRDRSRLRELYAPLAD